MLSRLTEAMSLSTTASPPPELEEGLLPHDGDGYDANDDDGASFDVVSLDEEGFPSQVPVEDGSPNGSEKSSFAADFYNCGTNFSSLLSLPEDNGHRDSIPSGKKLKQANLFQIWGFKRNDTVSSVESEPNQGGYRDDGGDGSVFSERKIVKPGNRGSISRDKGKVFENSNSSRKRNNSHGEENRVPRTCPFYKKLPGEMNFLLFILI